MPLPEFYSITQSFPRKQAGAVYPAVRKALEGLPLPGRILSGRIKSGQSVAVAAASRGTADMKDITLAVLHFLQDMGLRPFLFPAMGSHGGGTAEGQAEVLRALGLGEEETGIPIVSSLNTVSFGRLATGCEVFFSADALKADHIVAINRVKPHTVFRGAVESGLCKLLAVGCGKLKGARNMHRYSLRESIVPAACRIMEEAPLLLGLAVTENGWGETAEIAAVLPEDFIATDKRLLRSATELLPRIPTDQLDLLIVDEMGKDISGPGMDTNVIGLWRRNGGPRKPDYRYLVVLDLTEKSQGNAAGIGMADITTERTAAKVDWQATGLNALTAGAPRNGSRPLLAPNDRRAIELALEMLPDAPEPRIVRIKNTAELTRFWATAPVCRELQGREGISCGDTPYPLPFDAAGHLLAMGK